MFLFLVVKYKKRDKCVRGKINTLESIKEVDDKASSSTRTCSIAMLQFTTSSRRLDGGAYCGAPVGGKCMVSKAKLVLYAFAV